MHHASCIHTLTGLWQGIETQKRHFQPAKSKSLRKVGGLVAKEVNFRLRSVSGLQILGFRSLSMMDRRWEIRIPITDEIKLDDLM